MKDVKLEFFEDMFDFEREVVETDDDKVSMWVKDKDLFIPSTDISVTNLLPPGTYKVDNTNDRGLHCKKLEIETDNLYKFKDSAVESLLSEINLFWDKKKIYEEYEIIHKRGILLLGFPGNGKTSLIDLVSKELIIKGGVIFKIDDAANFVHYLDFMKYGFKKIQPNTPIITILEDLDQYGQVESRLLDFLDGQNQFSNHLVIATSNNIEEVPDSFLRPSRIDLKIVIDYPSEEVRREFFKFKNAPNDKLDDLVKITEDCTFADLKEVFITHFVLDYSIEDAITKVKSPFEKKDYSSFANRRSKLGL